MFDIDVHIIRFKEPDWMMDRCLSSLNGQPVNIHIVKGEAEFPAFKARAKGFSKGHAPYVSYVDPDDEVKPGAYEKMLKSYGFDLIWGKEEIWVDGVFKHNYQWPHHAYCIKRGLALDYPRGAPPVTYAALQKKITSRFIDEVFYKWNASAGDEFNKREELTGWRGRI